MQQSQDLIYFKEMDRFLGKGTPWKCKKCLLLIWGDACPPLLQNASPGKGVERFPGSYLKQVGILFRSVLKLETFPHTTELPTNK